MNPPKYYRELLDPMSGVDVKRELSGTLKESCSQDLHWDLINVMHSSFSLTSPIIKKFSFTNLMEIRMKEFFDRKKIRGHRFKFGSLLAHKIVYEISCGKWSWQEESAHQV